MGFKVKNIKGTSDNKCECDSWIEHWKNEVGKHSTNCIVKSCNKVAEHGGHVIRTDTNNNKWYIIPLCSSHNNWKNNEEYELENHITDKELAKASVNETCKK
jgi:hypothetical protein